MGVEDSNAPAVAPKEVLTEYVNGAIQTPPAVAEVLETAPEEVVKPVETSEDKMFGKKFAALSRKEKELRARDKAFQDKEKALEKRLADLEAQYGTKEAELSSKYIDPEKFKANPLEEMKRTGLTFEQLAQRVLNDGKPGTEEVMSDQEKRVEAKLAALEKKLAEKEEAEKKREEEANQKKFEENMASFKAQLTDFCNKETDYEMIRANDAVGLVFEVIEEHYAKTLDQESGQGQILSNKEAADAVENYLLDEAKKQMSLSKVKALAQQVVAKPTEGKPATSTLSNTHSAQAVSSKSGKFLSDDESRKEAAKLIKWQD